MELKDLAGTAGFPEFNSLSGCLPETIAREAKLHQLANARGIDYKIAPFGGLRTQAMTDLLMQWRREEYAIAIKHNPKLRQTPIEKWRPIAPFTLTRHRVGSAFDVIITRLPKGMSTSAAMALLGSLAEKYCNLKWGGHFPEDRIDVKHFELAAPFGTLEGAWLAFQKGARTLGAGAVAATEEAAASAGAAAGQAVTAARATPGVVDSHKAVTALVILLATVFIAMRALRA